MPMAVRNALTAMAKGSATREVCGFILKGWVIYSMRNVSERGDQFEMDNQELLDFFGKNYYDILGVYHSHCDGQRHPSDRDVLHMQPQWRNWIVTFDDVLEWELKDGELREVSA